MTTLKRKLAEFRWSRQSLRTLLRKIFSRSYKFTVRRTLDFPNPVLVYAGTHLVRLRDTTGAWTNDPILTAKVLPQVSSFLKLVGISETEKNLYLNDSIEYLNEKLSRVCAWIGDDRNTDQIRFRIAEFCEKLSIYLLTLRKVSNSSITAAEITASYDKVIETFLKESEPMANPVLCSQLIRGLVCFDPSSLDKDKANRLIRVGMHQLTSHDLLVLDRLKLLHAFLFLINSAWNELFYKNWEERKKILDLPDNLRAYLTAEAEQMLFDQSIANQNFEFYDLAIDCIDFMPEMEKERKIELQNMLIDELIPLFNEIIGIVIGHELTQLGSEVDIPLQTSKNLSSNGSLDNFSLAIKISAKLQGSKLTVFPLRERAKIQKLLVDLRLYQKSDKIISRINEAFGILVCLFIILIVSIIQSGSGSIVWHKLINNFSYGIIVLAVGIILQKFISRKVLSRLFS